MKYLRLLLFVIIAFVPSLSGIAVETGEWYALLNKPKFTPPDWIFAPVWTFLYFLIGLSGWLVWESKASSYRLAFVFYFIQLICNALWTILFFGLHQPLIALFDLLCLGFFLILNIIYFWNISLLAGVLLLPYLGWISFAGYLNFKLWQLN